MQLNIQEIMQIIPHRQPFLLIDAVEECEPGVSCVARKCVTMNESFFGGHFPGQPVMPGVLILEALAQTGAVAVLSLEEYKGKTAFFGGMDKVKFKRMVVPGDVLRLETSLVKMKGPVGVAKAMAYVGEKIAAEAELTVIIK